MKIVLLLSLLLLPALALKIENKRQVHNLPGQQQQLPQHQMFSGYLNGRQGRNLFYFLVQASAESERPLMLWLNGGPGCSSLGGLLSTNGPFIVTKDMQLEPNPWSWHEHVDLLYIESPVGVGFSFAESPKPQTDWNDANTTKDIMQALRHFVKLFPTRTSRDFYIFGESYAGVYVSLLAEALMQDKPLITSLKLRGIGIGNGYIMGRDAMMDARQEFAEMLGLTYDPENDRAPFNMYNIADYCYVTDHNESYKCVNTTAMEHYLRDSKVQAVLGVASPNRFFKICNGAIFNHYVFRTEAMHQLKTLMQQHAGQLKLLMYNGNLDFLLPYHGTLRLAQKLFKNNSSNNRQAWSYCVCLEGSASLQYGGDETKFLDGAVSVRSVVGAGHSTPTYRPQASLQMLRDFLGSKRVDNCRSVKCDATNSGRVLRNSVLLLLISLLLASV